MMRPIFQAYFDVLILGEKGRELAYYLGIYCRVAPVLSKREEYVSLSPMPVR